MNRHPNPTLFLQTNPDDLPSYVPGELSAAWRRQTAAAFAPPVLWVRHPANGLVHAWQIEPVDVALVERLLESGPAEFGDNEFARLERLGAAYGRETRARLATEFEQAVAIAQDSLRRQGYAVLRNLMLPGYHLQIRRYFDRIWDRIKLGDAQVPRRKAQHNDPLCRIFHMSLNDTIASVCEEPIKPSYSYLGIYMPGAVLVRHRDRPQCRWNVSLLLDSNPVASESDGWPIYVECPDDEVRAAVAGVGDAIVYNGTQIPHWREEMPSRFDYQSVCFFHFVQAEFAGVLV